MRGYATLYRPRLGDYRIGIEVIEDEVIFVRILHRKDIYTGLTQLAKNSPQRRRVRGESQENLCVLCVSAVKYWLLLCKCVTPVTGTFRERGATHLARKERK
ncbi:MAG: type II toxin-antitoxin system RelE family toxin [Anaerolineae bacterium]